MKTKRQSLLSQLDAICTILDTLELDYSHCSVSALAYRRTALEAIRDDLRGKVRSERYHALLNRPKL